MKRVSSFLFAVVLATLCGCGGGDSGTGSPSTPSPANNPPAIGGTASPADGLTNTTVFHCVLNPSDPDGDAVEVRIDFNGDGTWDTAYSGSTAYDHAFPLAGTYIPKVQARDSNGAESNVVSLNPVVVNDPAPTNNPPLITGTVSPATGEPAATVFSFVTSPSDPDGDPVQVRIDYEGDGIWDVAYGSQAVFTHTYPQAGTYTARMQARDSIGAESSVVSFNAVTVSVPPPGTGIPGIDSIRQEFLDAVNLSRSVDRMCGSTSYPATSPVAWSDVLAMAAYHHSEDMAINDFFLHTGSDGSTPGERITREGYDWWTYGENIAVGYPTVSAVMQAWLGSEGHCRNIMNPAFEEIGAAYAEGQYQGTSDAPYWTFDLATPR